MQSERLRSETLHMLRLADRDGDIDGWVNLSKTIWPDFKENVHDDLYEGHEREDGTGWTMFNGKSLRKRFESA